MWTKKRREAFFNLYSLFSSQLSSLSTSGSLWLIATSISILLPFITFFNCMVNLLESSTILSYILKASVKSNMYAKTDQDLLFFLYSTTKSLFLFHLLCLRPFFPILNLLVPLLSPSLPLYTSVCICIKGVESLELWS